ncbi:outer membrane beta-barrel protein [Helicobacter cetorum]|nr:outer membrane beta-barrel protein [Helicobacter cetorum]
MLFSSYAYGDELQEDMNNKFFKKVKEKLKKAHAQKQVDKTKKRYADKSAFYLGVGYEFDFVSNNLFGISSTGKHTSKTPSMFNGLGVAMGYKYILKKHKWLGFRGGAFYDVSVPFVSLSSIDNEIDNAESNLNNTINGMNNSMNNAVSGCTTNQDTTTCNYSSSVCTTSQDTINCNYSDYSSSSNGSIDYAIGTPQISAIQTYGANLDVLLNVANHQRIFFGFRVGIGLAGASYSISNSSDYASYLKPLKDKVNNTTFQFLVNLGMRIGGKHNHFEWGVKIPTINNTYFDIGSQANSQIQQAMQGLGSFGSSYALPSKSTMRRFLALYFEYIFSF